jgi:glyoxylase-like metal-dependent hydrolase (beta-lactamase superfamily II)
MLIDPGYYEKEIEDFIRSERINVIGIVHTHGHADHVAGDIAFGFPVMIHELDACLFENGMKELSGLLNMPKREIRPAKLLKDGDVIVFGSKKFTVIHTPGHTPGGICLEIEGMLFSGDTLFFEGVGRADFPYSDQDALLKSIKERLFVLPDDTRVFPGHGPDTTIGHEKRFNPCL